MKFKVLNEGFNYSQSVLNAADKLISDFEGFMLDLTDLENLSDFIAESQLQKLEETLDILTEFKESYSTYATIAAREKVKEGR